MVCTSLSASPSPTRKFCHSACAEPTVAQRAASNGSARRPRINASQPMTLPPLSEDRELPGLAEAFGTQAIEVDPAPEPPFVEHHAVAPRCQPAERQRRGHTPP